MIEISIEDVDEEIADRVDELLLEISNDLVNELIEEAPVDTGQLRQSFRIMGKSGDSGYIIGTPLKYASVVNFGRQPHPGNKGKWPPIEPLKKWVRRKLGAEEGLAYYIRDEIGKGGTEGDPYAERAIRNVKEKYG